MGPPRGGAPLPPYPPHHHLAGPPPAPPRREPLQQVADEDRGLGRAEARVEELPVGLPPIEPSRLGVREQAREGPGLLGGEPAGDQAVVGPERVAHDALAPGSLGAGPACSRRSAPRARSIVSSACSTEKPDPTRSRHAIARSKARRQWTSAPRRNTAYACVRVRPPATRLSIMASLTMLSPRPAARGGARCHRA